MTHDEISRFFSEEDVKKAFRFPDWPAGTEVVCYCRSTDSHDTIEQIARRAQREIVKYVHIDELVIGKLFKPRDVMFAKREAVEWKFKPTPIDPQIINGERIMARDKKMAMKIYANRHQEAKGFKRKK